MRYRTTNIFVTQRLTCWAPCSVLELDLEVGDSSQPCWVLVKGFRLSYYYNNKETILFAIDPYNGHLY